MITRIFEPFVNLEMEKRKNVNMIYTSRQQDSKFREECVMSCPQAKRPHRLTPTLLSNSFSQMPWKNN